MERSKPKVLVVDDDRVLADSLAQILNLHGFVSTALYSGEEAVEFVDGFRPDIVLSDIRMRQVDGIEAAKRIRELHPECRVILFTASSVDLAARKKIEGLGFEFLQRPLHPEGVLKALGRPPSNYGEGAGPRL